MRGVQSGTAVLPPASWRGGREKFAAGGWGVRAGWTKALGWISCPLTKLLYIAKETIYLLSCDGT